MIIKVTYNDTSDGVHRLSTVGNFTAEYKEELLPAITEGEEGTNLVWLRLKSGDVSIGLHTMFGVDKLSYDERKAVLTLIFEELDKHIQSLDGVACDLSEIYKYALATVQNK